MTHIFRDFAPRYLTLGWYVLPLKPGTKIAFLPGGWHAGSNDPEQIALWCREYPMCNIGIRCGVTSGITVIDIDPRHGGFETVEKLALRKQTFPDTAEARSCRDGRHLYYAYDERVGGGKDKLGPGIDIKTEGGYIVAPPSWWNGMEGGEKVGAPGIYGWVRPPLGRNHPRLPRWLIEALKPRPRPRYSGPPSVITDEREKEWLDRIAREPEGNRNGMLNAMAFYLFRAVKEAGENPETRKQAAIDAGVASGQNLKAVTGTVESALTTVMNN